MGHLTYKIFIEIMSFKKGEQKKINIYINSTIVSFVCILVSRIYFCLLSSLTPILSAHCSSSINVWFLYLHYSSLFLYAISVVFFGVLWCHYYDRLLSCQKRETC